MRTTIVHGQNHRGSTYHVAWMLAEKLGGEITEFFLPRDFGSFCTGCCTCFTQSETQCPHYQKLLPITRALDGADIIILASPVYVYHVTGAMKALLDHYGYRWMVHRPRRVCLSSRPWRFPLRQGRGWAPPIKIWLIASFTGAWAG